jgi:HEAT repeat protein
VWVLGRVGRASNDAVAAGGSAGQPQEAAHTKQAVDHNTSTLDNAQIQPADVHHLMEMANSSDPAIRLEALSSLAENGGTDQDVSRSAFDTAITDEDPNIRGLAVQTLANQGGPEPMNYLWQGLSDPDPAVRVMAVQTTEPNGQGLALLQEALTDTDESVRAIAEFRLTHRGNLNADH